MKRYKLNFNSDPSFNTITGLNNTTFNPTTTVENRMATEAQIQELYQDIVAAEQRRDYCCRDIIVWEARTQVVRLNTNAVGTGQGETFPNAPGVVISTIDENVNIGTMRRGLSYTVTFPLKWDDNLYVKNITPFSSTPSSGNGCEIPTINNATTKGQVRVNAYLYVENNNIWINSCSSTRTNRAQFLSLPNVISGQFNTGTIINPNNNWGSFVFNKLSDGTITIKDNRRNTNFNVIRFYTQWLLKECADGSIFSDWEILES